MTPGEAIATHVLARSGTSSPLLIGVTGSVAVGKTMATGEAVALLVAGGVDATSICTDGFLYPNAELEHRGLAARKGFPETYDVDAIRSTVGVVKRGDTARVPQYSHVTYDVAGECTIDAAAVVLIDGLHLEVFVGDLVDAVVHLDAEHEVIERWYVDRLMALIEAAETDDSSFYRWAVPMGLAERVALARWFWGEINLANLVEHIDPARGRADLILRLASDHSVLGPMPDPMPD